MIFRLIKSTVLSVIIICLGFGIVMGGTKGKIVGKVIDANTREPMAFVNVIIEGTGLGAATDLKGYYVILNIPPGKYSVKASYLGYKIMIVNNVQVNADKTTEVNFEIAESVTEGETIVITAKRPLIQKDVTSKETIIMAETIEDMPISDVTEILDVEANIIDIPRSIEGTSIGFPYYSDLGIPQVHLRGGRVGEVQYLVDGMSVSNPIFGEMAVKLNKEAIREMQILAGSFNAEYGNAMSGVISIVTKEGSPEWGGTLDYKTTELGTESDRLWGIHDISGSITGPLSNLTGIKDMSFFASFRTKKGADNVYEFDDIVYDPENPNKTYLGYGKPRLVNPLDTIAGWRALGFNNTTDGMLKITIPVSTNMKLNFSGSASWWKYKLANFWFLYNMENRNTNEHRTLNLTAALNHTLNSTTFYTLGISRFYKSRKQRLYRNVDGNEIELMPSPLDPADIDSTKLDYYYRSPELHDPYYSEFNTGDDEFWTNEFQTTYNVKFDLTSQLSRYHLIKTGFDLQFFNLDVNEQEEIHPGGAHYTTIYKTNPMQAAVYLQDKIEYDFLIINAGLRLSYDKSEGEMWTDPTEWKSEIVGTKPTWRLAPRLGVALPITDKTVFHFNSGIFYQPAIYRNRFLYPDREYALTSIWPLLGNPLLEPEKTSAYELGVKQEINPEMFLEVNLWLKKTSNMVGTVWVPNFSDSTHTNPQYGVFSNLDFSSARGIDITIKKRFSSYSSFELNYSWSKATGIREDPWQGYRSRHTPQTLPKLERILDWNQPHVIRFNLFFRFPHNIKNPVLRDMRMSLFYRGNSGFPYTPSTVREEAIGPINSMQRPWNHTIDIRLMRQIKVKSFMISPYVEIDNVFDRKNVVFSYITTGSTTDPGDIWAGTTTYRDRPHYYGPRRQIRTGIKFRFK